MARSAAQAAVSAPFEKYTVVCPVSLQTGWTEIIKAGGVTIVDANPILSPETTITDATRQPILRLARGTTLLLSMKYLTTLVVTVSPVVKVFGRSGAQAWQLLKTKQSLLTATLAVVTATDLQEGGFSRTTPDLIVTAWDCAGCDELMVGIETALAVSAGSTATTTIEAKFI